MVATFRCNQTAGPRAFQAGMQRRGRVLYERFSNFSGMRYLRAAGGSTARDASKGTKFAAPAVAAWGEQGNSRCTASELVTVGVPLVVGALFALCPRCV
jgi:hypothetical protein